MFFETALNVLFHGKYRGWYGSIVEICCWADLARLSAGIKNSPKNLCGHVIFIVFFKYQIKIAGGDGINHFFFENPSILMYNLSLQLFRTKRSPIFYWCWQYIMKCIGGPFVSCFN